MPLPWKKARISRISRLMADLHPSKPCNPLLLQTGFPASLVDLFVKNSDRLKKPNKKKKRNRKPDRNLSRVSVPDLVHSPAADEIPQVKSKDDLDFDVSRSADRGFESECKSNEILNTGCCNGDGSGAFYAVFVAFVAVILALISIKILTLGITMSACALICLDCARKHVLCSCSGFPLQFPFGLFVSSSVRFRTQIAAEAKPEEKEDRIELVSPVEEIQVVESEVQFEGTEIDSISEEEEGDDDDECNRETLEKVAIRGRSRSKGFMKKLVPKKWRKAKTAEKRDAFAGGQFSDQELIDSGGSVKEVTGDQKIEDLQPKEEIIKISNELVDKKEASSTVRKEKRGCCCFVVVAALAGLVGGRVVAMGLTVVSCVVVRLFVMRQRQQLNNMKRMSLGSS